MGKKLASALCAVGVAGLLMQASACKRPDPGTYKTPEEAVAALQALVGTGDEQKSDEIFGPKSVELFRTGDAEEDRKNAERVKSLMAEKIAFEDVDDNTKVALFGNEAWPFPIPIAKIGERWHFDTEAGRSELLNRRIGYYELLTLDSLRAYVAAQHEYAATAHDGLPLAYAQRLRSTEGHQDGLYWPAAEGEGESPLGDLLSNATAHTLNDATPQPFQGYWFRILKGQGENAPGGARSYLNAKGLMTGGFALIAWPAKYGNSGIMTFIINQQGIPFQKDLGPDTEKLAADIQTFDPDASWNPTGDGLPADDTADDDAAEAAPDATPEKPVQ